MKKREESRTLSEFRECAQKIFAYIVFQTAEERTWLKREVQDAIISDKANSEELGEEE